MIAYIKGKLVYIHDDSVIVEVGGIGYEIICGNPLVFQSSLNEEVFIHIYHHVREDLQNLYGFKDQDEKHLFTKLISVSGIGPKSGIAILGGADVSDFVAAVEHEDEKYLTQFPGVGKKTARQIILDLKGKLTNLLTITDQPGKSKSVERKTSTGLTEAMEALKVLGYSEQEIRSIVPELRKEEHLDTDEMIRKALGLLMKK